jgi:hypothetical protein
MVHDMISAGRKTYARLKIREQNSICGEDGIKVWKDFLKE